MVLAVDLVDARRNVADTRLQLTRVICTTNVIIFPAASPQRPMNSRDSALDETQEPKATAPILPSSSVRVSSPSSYEGAKSGAVTAPARTARIPRAPNSSKQSLLAAFLAGPSQKRDHTYPIVKHPVTPHCALWRRWPRRPIIFGVTATRGIQAASHSARLRHEGYGCRLTSAIPRAAIDATAPTSRSTFRLLARAIDATNREADSLRHALLAQWTEHAGARELVDRLQSLDRSDPDGALGVDARLMVWFSFAEPKDDQLVTADDPVLSGLSDELRSRLASIARSAQD